jgi:hypothetical protein
MPALKAGFVAEVVFRAALGAVDDVFRIQMSLPISRMPSKTRSFPSHTSQSSVTDSSACEANQPTPSQDGHCIIAQTRGILAQLSISRHRSISLPLSPGSTVTCSTSRA